MTDANVRIPVEARDRLAEVAAAEGLSLRAYLARLAGAVLTPAERAAQAEQARAVLREWNGYDPTAAEEAELDAELDRRLAEAHPAVTVTSTHVVLDDAAMLAAGRGSRLASRLIHRAHTEPGTYLYAPACALVEADRARPGVAEHIASLPGVTILELDLPAALAVARESTWAVAHTRYVARPNVERPGGAVVATGAPARWAGQPVRVLDVS